MRSGALALAWLSFLMGALAFWTLISGYEQSVVLPTTPRPGMGPGFSESATAMFGGALVGWWLSIAGTLFGCLSLAFGERKRFKVLLSLPSAIYFAAPLIHLLK
jgi:hypothetical protein